MYGYENLPSKPMQGTTAMKPAPDGAVDDTRIKYALVDKGYLEVVTYSFVDPGLQKLLVPGASAPKLANPISADMAVMRASIWPGLISAAIYNLNRQQNRIRIFEMGTCFATAGKRARETGKLAALAVGNAVPEQWSEEARETDFYDLKGDLEYLLDICGLRDRVRYVPTENDALHPGQGADILLNGKNIGSIGRIHPEIQAKLDLDRPIYVFELEKAAINLKAVPKFAEISRFPAIRRDIALVVAENVRARAVLDCIETNAGELLVDLELFDEYRGEGIDSGRKSLALGLILQDSSRTLKEEVVEAVMNRVVDALRNDLGAELRT